MFSNNDCFYFRGIVNNNNKESFEDQFSTPIKEGHIVITAEDNISYIYTGNDWNLLTTDIGYYEQEPTYRKLLPQICKCCGAPLHNHKCEYCGVEYA